jgi:hypothetical protein
LCLWLQGWSNSFGTGRRLRVELLINQGTIPSKCQGFFFSPPKISAPCEMGTRKNLSIGKEDRDVKLTINIYLVPSLRMNGARLHSLTCIHSVVQNFTFYCSSTHSFLKWLLSCSLHIYFFNEFCPFVQSVRVHLILESDQFNCLETN